MSQSPTSSDTSAPPAKDAHFTHVHRQVAEAISRIRDALDAVERDLCKPDRTPVALISSYLTKVGWAYANANGNIDNAVNRLELLLQLQQEVIEASANLIRLQGEGNGMSAKTDAEAAEKRLQQTIAATAQFSKV